ncbi:hypothetical protein GCM10022235_73070 [Kribbella ginsengisoli]|uniref:Uncharacterized protein n=2 Tax=Kribbella ginsengisoli TaxID=363865 RepID=A0ABP6YU09_9ACTN
MHSMRRWLTGILSGLLYGVLFGVGTHYLMHLRWSAALIAGAASGPPFGVLIALVKRRGDRALSSLPGDLTRKERQAAVRAALRGPVPTDPAIRAAALDYGRRQLDRYRTRWMRVLLILMPILFVLLAVSTLLDDDRPWWRAIPQLLGAAAFGVMAFERRRLRRRVAELSAADNTGDHPTMR